MPIHDPVLVRTSEEKRERLLGNALVYTLSNVLASTIPFLLLPLLTRALTPEQYGIVAIFSVLVSIFGAFAGLSVHGAVNVRYFDLVGSHPRYVATALAILACSTSVLLLGVVLVSPWLSGWTQLPRGWLVMGGVAAAAQFLINIRLVMWQVRGEALHYGVFQVMQTAFNLGLSILLIVGLGMGSDGRLVGIACAFVVFAAIALVSLQRAGLVQWKPDRAYAKDAMRFGVPLIPHVVGTLFIASSDRLMVANLMTVRDAGVYAAGMQIGMVIAVLADASVKAITPWLYARLSDPDPALNRRVVRYTYAYFGVIALFSLAFGAAAPWLLMLVGEEFRSSREVVVYVALGGAFGGMYLMVVNYIFFAKRNEWLSGASLCVGIFNLGVSYLLVRSQGAVGAAQAYALSQLLLFVAVWFISHRHHPMPWRAALWPAIERPVRT